MRRCIMAGLAALVLAACGPSTGESQATSITTTTTILSRDDLPVCSATETYLSAGGPDIEEASKALLNAATIAPNPELREAASWLARRNGFDQDDYNERTGSAGQERAQIIQDLCGAAGRSIELPSR